MATGAVIDFDKIEQEVGQMSEEDLRSALTKLKVAKLKQQANQYDPERSKAYRLKKQAKFKALVAQAQKLGIHDEIHARAKELVAQEVGEAEADRDE